MCLLREKALCSASRMISSGASCPVQREKGRLHLGEEDPQTSLHLALRLPLIPEFSRNLCRNRINTSRLEEEVVREESRVSLDRDPRVALTTRSTSRSAASSSGPASG